MYIIKNAVRNLHRNKGWNIFIFLIFLVIILASSLGIIIHSAMEQSITDYSDRFEIKGYLKADYFSFLGEADPMGLLNIPDITADDYEKFSKSDYVEKYYAYAETTIHADGLEPVGIDKDRGAWDSILQDREGLDTVFYEVTGMLRGYTDISLLTDFIEGNRKITAGRVYNNNEECIVSEEWANANNIKVNDIITVRLCRIDAAQEIELKITGIFKDFNQYGTSYYAELNPLNDIITNYNTVTLFNSQYYNVEAQFVLKNTEVIELFEEELISQGLPNGYYLSTNKEDYDTIVAPVLGLKKISQTFLAVVLFLGSIILVITLLLSVKARKNEIGTLRSKGMSKIQVFYQFLFEDIILLAACLLIGTSLAMTAAQPISNYLMEEQNNLIAEQALRREESYQDYFYSDSQEITDFGNQIEIHSIEDVSISLTKNSVLQIVLIALIMCIMSSAIGLIYLNRYEPMKLLSERD